MNEKTKAFYDAFVGYQQKAGVNERIYSLYRRMKRFGLNKGSAVLELGCGIGSLTGLVAGTVSKGIVEAVDLSPASVDRARARVRQKNVTFANADIVSYRPSAPRFDLITLFDVVEHIPESQHAALFDNVAAFMADETVLLMNVPNPASIEYDRKHHPEHLQAIDLPVTPESLLKHLSRCGLSLLFYEKYSIWMHHDYVFYAVEKNLDYTGRPPRGRHTLSGRIKAGLLRIWLNFLSRNHAAR